VRPETYHEINNFYTATVYQKGAEVVRMLKTLLGERGFRAGMDLYFTRCDGKAATVEDFLGCFADANGVDLTQFKLWYSQAGTPELALRGSFDAERSTYRLEVRQMVPPTPGQSAKQPMLIPLAFGVLGKDGGDLPLKPAKGSKISDGILRISAAEETFVFDGIRERPIPSFNRGFSAPIKLVSNLGEDDLVFIAGHDSDAFNRFDAASTLAMHHLVASAAAIRAKRTPPSPKALISALARSFDDDRLDPAFVAQVTAVPSEADIAHEIGSDVDPDAVLAARKGLKRTLGEALAARCQKIYERLSPRAPYSPDAASAGGRALKNACLDLVAATGAGPGIERVLRQFREADNMTDRFAALAILSTHDVAERELAFDEFQKLFGENPLVMDKWFALQAQIPEPATLDRVRALMRHPAFSLANPNRVRSLIGAFAAGNPSQFNRQDGEGYAFLADFALKLDPKNPQVAARLFSSFKSWRALEPVRRAAAETELKRVAAANLSTDSRDIVGRALA
jgi:aminopeptidase N